MRINRGVVWLFTFAAALGIGACSSGGGTPPIQTAKLAPGGGALSGVPGEAIPKQYTLTDLGTGIPGSPGLVPTAVNDNGVVVGDASGGILSSLPSCKPSACGPPIAWIATNGTAHPLPTPTIGAFTFADDINDAGVVAGGFSSTTEFAVLWKPDGTTVNLGSGIAPENSAAEASGISNSGIVVGVSFNGNTGNPVLPTFFDGKGGATDPCGSGVQGELRKVNDAGVAVGDQFLAQGGTSAVTCPPLQVIASSSDPTFLNFGFDINNSGDEVGRLGIGPTITIFHPFLRHAGATTDLGTLFPGSSTAVGAAMGVNDAGVAVGFSAQAGAVIGPPPVPPVNPRAFVYANGKMVDLNTLLPASCANWTLVVAKDINNRGQIVGAAFVGGYPGGVEHAFLLTPVK